MVTAVTSLGRNGLADWVVQRVTAVILLAYTIFISVVVFGGDVDFVQWQQLFASPWVRGFTFAAILSLAMHGWIGLWSVSTDYLTVRLLGAKANPLRWLFQAASAVVLFAYVVWAIEILWG